MEGGSVARWAAGGAREGGRGRGRQRSPGGGRSRSDSAPGREVTPKPERFDDWSVGWVGRRGGPPRFGSPAPAPWGEGEARGPRAPRGTAGLAALAVGAPLPGDRELEAAAGG